MTGVGPEGSVSLASSDVDEATEKVGEVFHPHRLTRVGPVNRFHAALDAVSVGAMVSGRLRYNSNSDLHCPTIDGYHVNVPLTGKLLSISRGVSTPVLPDKAAVYSTGADARILSPEHSRLNLFAVKFARSAVHETLQDLLGRQIEEPVRFRGVLDLSSPDGRAWWTLLVNTHRSQLLGSMMRDPRMAAPLTQSVMTGLLTLTENQFSAELQAPVAACAPSMVARAIEFIHASAGEPLTVADIARAVGLNVRTLQRSFHRHAGTSPMQFLRDVRMRRAHEDLLAGDPGVTSVTVIAARWGFTNHGRFAQDYRRAYGTSPSETLRAHR